MNAANLSLGGVTDIINVSTPSQVIRKGDTEIFDHHALAPSGNNTESG